ncbi:AP2 domain transcription factor AP2VIII-3 [Toxoplasma gondii VEG]|uniref:AP2 domain transcription factor AP2VIII-3 n=1 Tax=Toxoplasma gondii (strain ATCC 50861 / VEG) TaxID=432359 RepID=B9Q465_TOXGV|nr:AP2 domain transcription factor AP2VIII-3 [Toxoplasma gondii VEG]CEL75094.1 TPA: AP2 domain transcription factor AP2VIII-3 [Toxoplasma gondii VEG]
MECQPLTPAPRGFPPIPSQPCMLAVCKDDSGLLTPVNAVDATPSSCSTNCTTSPDASPSAATSGGTSGSSAFSAAAINCATSMGGIESASDSSTRSPSHIDPAGFLAASGVLPPGAPGDGLAVFLSQKEQWHQLLTRNQGVAVTNRVDPLSVLGDLKSDAGKPSVSVGGVSVAPSQETREAFAALRPRGVPAGMSPTHGGSANAAAELAALSCLLQSQHGAPATPEDKRRDETALLLFFQQLQAQQLARQMPVSTAGAANLSAFANAQITTCSRASTTQPLGVLPFTQPLPAERTQMESRVRTDAPLTPQTAAGLSACTSTGRGAHAGQVKRGGGTGRSLARSGSDAAAAAVGSQEKGQAAGVGEKPRTVFIGNNKASYHPDKQEWRTRYYQDGRRCMRTYSAKYYGYEKAKCLAECFIRFVQTYGALPSQQTLLLAAERLQQQAVAQSADTDSVSSGGASGFKPAQHAVSVSRHRTGGSDVAALPVAGQLSSQDSAAASWSGFPFAPVLPQCNPVAASQTSLVLPLSAPGQTPGTAGPRGTRALQETAPARVRTPRAADSKIAVGAVQSRGDEGRSSRRASVKRRRDSAGTADDATPVAASRHAAGPLTAEGRLAKLLATTGGPKRLDAGESGVGVTESPGARGSASGLAAAVAKTSALEASVGFEGTRRVSQEEPTSPVAEVQQRVAWNLPRNSFPGASVPVSSSSATPLPQVGDGVSAPTLDPAALSSVSSLDASVSPASLASALQLAAVSKPGKAVKFNEKEDGGQSPRERKACADGEAANAEAGRESRCVRKAGKRDGRQTADGVYVQPVVGAGRLARSDSKANVKSSQGPREGDKAKGKDLGVLSKSADVSTVESAVDDDSTASLLQAFFDGCISESLLGGVPLIGGAGDAKAFIEQEGCRDSLRRVGGSQELRWNDSDGRLSIPSSLSQSTSTRSTQFFPLSAVGAVEPSTSSYLSSPVTAERREAEQLLRRLLACTEGNETAAGSRVEGTGATTHSLLSLNLQGTPVAGEFGGQVQSTFTLPGTLGKQGSEDRARLWDAAVGTFGISAEEASIGGEGRTRRGRACIAASLEGSGSCGYNMEDAGEIQDIVLSADVEAFIRAFGAGAGHESLGAQRTAGQLFEEGVKLLHLHDASLRTVSTLPGATLDALSDFCAIHRLSDRGLASRQSVAPSETPQQAPTVSPSNEGASEAGNDVSDTASQDLVAKKRRRQEDFPLTLACSETLGTRLMNSHVASLSRLACASEAPLFAAFSSTLAGVEAQLTHVPSGECSGQALLPAESPDSFGSSPSVCASVSKALAALQILSLRTLRAATEAAQAAVAAARAEQEIAPPQRRAERGGTFRGDSVSSGSTAAGPSERSVQASGGDGALTGLGESDDATCSTSDSSSRLNDTVLSLGTRLGAVPRDEARRGLAEKLDDSSPRSDAERKTDVPLSPTHSQGSSHLPSEKSDSEGRTNASSRHCEHPQLRAALAGHLRRVRKKKEDLAQQLLEKFWALRTLQNQLKERLQKAEEERMRARQRHEAMTRVGTCAALAQQLFRDNIELLSMILTELKDARREGLCVETNQGSVASTTAEQSGYEGRTSGRSDAGFLRQGADRSEAEDCATAVDCARVSGKELTGEAGEGEGDRTAGIENGIIPESSVGSGTQREEGAAADESREQVETPCLREALQGLQNLVGRLKSRQEDLTEFLKSFQSMVALQREVLRHRCAALVAEGDVKLANDCENETPHLQLSAEEAEDLSPRALGDQGETRLSAFQVAEGAVRSHGPAVGCSAESKRLNSLPSEADASPRERVSLSEGRSCEGRLEDPADTPEQDYLLASKPETTPTLSSVDTHSGSVRGQACVSTSEDELRNGSDVGSPVAKSRSGDSVLSSSDEAGRPLGDRSDLDPPVGLSVLPVAMRRQLPSVLTPNKDGLGSGTDFVTQSSHAVSTGIPQAVLPPERIREERRTSGSGLAAALGVHELLRGTGVWPGVENKWALLQSVPFLASDALSPSVGRLPGQGEQMEDEAAKQRRALSQLALSRGVPGTAKEECASKETAAFLLSLQTENVPSMPEISTFLHLKGNGESVSHV